MDVAGTPMAGCSLRGRILRKNPGFTAVAVLSLALGIGANTALFSVADAVMLKTLPVRDPQQLRVVNWVSIEGSKKPIHSEDGYRLERNGFSLSGSFSYAAYQAFREHVPQFSDLIAYAGSQLTVTAHASSEVAIGWFVSGNYFDGLGVRPLAGRAIQPDDDAPGRPAVAVLGYRYWQKRFGLDGRVVGSDIWINQKPATVIGILPPSFQGLDPGSETDIFVPISQVPALAPAEYSLTEPFTWWVQIFGRLRPGASDAAAAQATQATLGALIQNYAGSGYAVPRVRLEDGARGVSYLREYASSRLYVLEGIVGMVLLIACVNLAHLLLARSAARAREIAVRLSIGASRGRLIRQLLTESVLLALAGGAVGLLLARALTALLAESVLASRGFLIPQARLDGRALLFMFLAAFLTAALSGFLPAWQATRTAPNPILKGGRTSGRGSRQYSSRLLIAGQVALSVLLLAGAGLFVRTLLGLMRVDLGFNSGNLLSFQTDASRSGYKGQKLADVYARMRERIAAIPGVLSVGLSNRSLIGGDETSDDVTMLANSPRPGEMLNVFFLACSDSLLSTMRIPVILGRGLAPSDGPGKPPVAVVNETFVKDYFLPGVDPIGQKFGGDAGTEIVGVVKDAHYSSVRAAVPPTAYVPYMQSLSGLDRMSFSIRTAVAPLSIAPAVRRAVAEVDSSIPVDRLRTMQDQVDLSLTSERTLAELVSAFGLAAALLAAIGLYGVMAYTVARRTSEIGIRIALGANTRSVAWLVVRESVWMIAAGLAIGIPLALLLARGVRSMLYGIAPNDPWSFAAAIVLMSTVGAIAAWIPARRASRVDPMTALRAD